MPKAVGQPSLELSYLTCWNPTLLPENNRSSSVDSVLRALYDPCVAGALRYASNP
jgi:hypothetical protein